jgi:hypothetical protein
MRNVSGKICRENQKTQLFLENRAVYETLWKNIDELDRSQMIIKYSACTMNTG